MNSNLHTLLSGPFYINPMYAVSCIPTLYQSFTLNSNSEKTIENLITERKTVNENASVKSTANKVVVVDFNQPVVKYDYYPWLGTQTYMNILKQLEADESVAGVVLNIDSGGGQVYGTGEFYDYIKGFSKPIVAFTHGYMCSGAYYIAAPTNKIIANKRADAIGSIGAYATIIDSNGLWEHFGAKVHTIYATKSTEKNSEYRDVLESDYESYIKNQLDPIVETFISDMKAVRPQLSEDVFKGGTWTGEQAVALGLVDENGTLEDAISAVFELSQVSKKSNSNTNMNTKSLPKVEAVLGLDAPLASTDNGSYLNADQLDTIEARLDSLETENSTLQTQATEAATAHTTAVEAIQGQLTEAQTTATAVEASVDAILANAGLPVTGTITEKLAAINGKAEAFGKLDGAKPTNVIVKEHVNTDATTEVGGVDISAAMNN